MTGLNEKLCPGKGCPRTVVPPAIFCPTCWDRVPAGSRERIANAWPNVDFEVKAAVTAMELVAMEPRA